MRARPSTVYLVGAGPGDPGLLTVAAAELLQSADIVYHDALVGESVLARVGAGTVLCSVGKRGGRPGAAQDAIEQRLVAEAKSGKSVVRLKGGDPFVFGRGGEEALACRRAGVPFVVLPGISSAIAGPAYAGIPVTHRGLARSFAVVTGTTESADDIDWAGFNGVDTLVILMAARRLHPITAALIAAGRSPTTPAAVIESATTAAQGVTTATLATIADDAERSGVQSPAVLVVGNVASLAGDLAWFEPGPLSGRSVVVTATPGRAPGLAALLRDAGASVAVIPAIEIEFSGDRAVAAHLETPWDWIVLPSRNAVEALVRGLQAAGRDARSLGAARLAVAGPGTADESRSNHLLPDFEPSEPGAAGIVAGLPLEPGARVLLLQSDVAPASLEQALSGRGASVTRVEAYRTLPRTMTPPQAATLASASAITFASPSAVRAIASGLTAHGASVESARLVAIGGTTAAALTRTFGRCDAVAATPDAAGVVAAVAEALT